MPLRDADHKVRGNVIVAPQTSYVGTLKLAEKELPFAPDSPKVIILEVYGRHDYPYKKMRRRGVGAKKRLREHE